MSGDEIIKVSARLRGQQKFREAIAVVQDHFLEIESDLVVLAYREMLLAADEGGFVREACGYAEHILQLEPGMPAAIRYLEQHPH